MTWSEFWNSVADFFVSNVWRIILFFAVLFIGIVIVRIIIRIFKRIFVRGRMEKIAQQFLIAIIKVTLYLVLMLVLLSIIGIKITGIITALSALLLAVGMALENNIANLANGIVIVATKMFKKGDYISVDGVEGNITDINFLFTTINTTDNKKVTIPNSAIVNGSVYNAGANEKRRVEFTFPVAYESDIDKVKRIVTDVMRSNGKVYLDPEPFCRLKTLGDSSLNFFSHCWCDTEDYWDVYYYITEKVYNEFKKNNITVPYNQLEVRARTDEVVMPFLPEPLPERVEKEREQPHKHESFSEIFRINKKNSPKKENPKSDSHTQGKK